MKNQKIVIKYDYYKFMMVIIIIMASKIIAWTIIIAEAKYLVQ